MTRPHVNPSALQDLVARSPLLKSEVASRAAITPGHLHDLLTARRSGKDDDLRRRVAEALDCQIASITCLCGDIRAHRVEPELAAEVA